MHNLFVELIEKSFEAYSDEQIENFYNKVKKEGLTEHGFPRLVSNMGTLLSLGKKPELLDKFIEMMDFCCENIPKVKAANDFSVREIILAIIAVSEAKVVPESKIKEWKTKMQTINPYTCYDVYATKPTDEVNNWAAFSMVSEWIRTYYGLCDDSYDFIDMQIENQILKFNEMGLYKDPGNPMLYDLVERALFVILLHFGYRGKYYKQIDDILKKAALHTLRMQSVTGELPYGGRSMQFLHNEPTMSSIFEYEANRYKKEGDLKTAGIFKNATKKAILHTKKWFDREKVTHVKNDFDIETKYGCEGYAYFDKYMITTASNLHTLCILSDDSILPVEMEEKTDAFKTSDDFHKLFLRAGDYFLEFDYDADYHYDSSGLGRIHKKDAPSSVCMSSPCTMTPNYTVDLDDICNLSLCPGVYIEDKKIFGADENVKHTVLEYLSDKEGAYATLKSEFPFNKEVIHTYKVTSEGVEISAKCDGKICYMLPAFMFDGKEYSVITEGRGSLEIEYKGYKCRYTFDGTLSEYEKKACNRNGHFKVYYITGDNNINLKVEIKEM